MSQKKDLSNAVNNYGINDEGIKSSGPGRAANQKSIPLISIVLTLSYKIVSNQASGDFTPIASKGEPVPGAEVYLELEGDENP
jgi:hypothetical protein